MEKQLKNEAAMKALKGFAILTSMHVSNVMHNKFTDFDTAITRVHNNVSGRYFTFTFRIEKDGGKKTITKLYNYRDPNGDFWNSNQMNAGINPWSQLTEKQRASIRKKVAQSIKHGFSEHYEVKPVWMVMINGIPSVRHIDFGQLKYKDDHGRPMLIDLNDEIKANMYNNEADAEEAMKKIQKYREIWISDKYGAERVKKQGKKGKGK